MEQRGGVHGEHMAEFNSRDPFEDPARLCGRLLGVTRRDFFVDKN